MQSLLNRGKIAWRSPITLALALIAASFIWHFVITIGKGSIISWDAFGYYFYLPMLFIEQGIVLDNLDYPNAIFKAYDPSSTLYQFTALENGRFIIRYPAGIAVIYAPFFFIGHLIANLSAYPADGFSAPYEYAMRVASIFYHLLAFVLIARLLRIFYSPKVVAWTLILLFFATNAFYYLLSSGLAANGTLLMMLALFMLAVHRYFTAPGFGKAIFAGIILGLMGLSRPTELAAIIPAALWPAAIFSLSFKELIAKLRTYPMHHYLSFAVATGLVGFTQLIYWKIAGGSWIINSYGNPAEGLDWLNPHTIPYLFSFKKGWFIYTPFMLLVVVFLFWNAWKWERKRMIPVVIYLIVFVYLASIWTNWWYGGGWGQRSIIQMYALLSIPLAAMILRVSASRSMLVKISFGFFAIACTALNFWQSWQYTRGIRTNESETAAYYFASFFDTQFDPGKAHLMAIDRFSIRDYDVYEIPSGYMLYATHPFHEFAGPQDIAGMPFFQNFQLPYADLCPGDHCWVAFEATFDKKPSEGLLMVMAMRRSDGIYGYRSYPPAHYQWGEYSEGGDYVARSFYITPHVRSESDRLQAYLWNRNEESVVVKDLKIKVYVNRWP